MAVSPADGPENADHPTRAKTLSNWLTFLAALGGLVIGVLLLWGVWDGKQVAAAFTRVGGETRVETALEASRFWLTPPQIVVETQVSGTKADASQLMLGAAQCAVAHDAPLLFTSANPKRQHLVDATISDWRRIETTNGPGRPEVITAQKQRDIWRAPALPEIITIQDHADVTRCLANGDLADIDRVSTLEASNAILRLPRVRVEKTLAPVVVFAAAIEPGDPPDVAVGLALAAHMARANGEDVSLVVVPHYLESDLELENKLQSQHKPVMSGVVLGQTPTVPEDTRALLRQLLTSRDRQGVLAQVQDNLGSVGPLFAALLAVAGFGAAAQKTPEITRQIPGLTHSAAESALKVTRGTLKRISAIAPFTGGIPRRIDGVKPRLECIRRIIRMPKNYGEPTPARAALLAHLEAGQSVTVWLLSQWKITGKVTGEYDDTSTVLRLENVKLEQQHHEMEADSVLVPVQEIQLIGVNVREPPQLP